VNHVVASVVRAFVLALTGGRVARGWGHGLVGSHVRALTRMSAAFAIVSETAMATLGGKLKRREKISGRLADALAWLYLGSATLKRFSDEGEVEADRPFVDWACAQALHEIQRALVGILDNLPARVAAHLVRLVVFPLGLPHRPPSDAQGGAVARALLEDHDGRRRLTRDIYVPARDEPGLGRLEAALEKAAVALVVEAKLRDAVRAGRLDRAPGLDLADAALAAGVISSAERQRLVEADAAREEAIQVDAFEAAALLRP
jgi:acyl-CoA dehydrogenase